jgi:hypothetical protein
MVVLLLLLLCIYQVFQGCDSTVATSCQLCLSVTKDQVRCCKYWRRLMILCSLLVSARIRVLQHESVIDEFLLVRY